MCGSRLGLLCRKRVKVEFVAAILGTWYMAVTKLSRVEIMFGDV
jgi:hypothetical protein